MSARSRFPVAPARAAGWLALALCLGLLILSRKPDVLLHAELWGDEGWTFYPDAYRIGLLSLRIPAGGYLDSVQRLVAVAAQPLALAWVPTAFAAAALFIQLLPALFLLSSRMAEAVPSRRVRLLLALLYVAQPNQVETYVNLTNSQWTLALLAVLVALGAPAASRVGLVFDVAVLALSGLSGPFMLLLAPVSLWLLRSRRAPADRLRLAIVLATAAIQLVVLLAAAHPPRSHAPLGAGPRLLARILSLQVILGAETGLQSFGRLTVLRAWQQNWLPLFLTGAGMLVATLALRRGGRTLRLFALFCGLLLAAALVSPQISESVPQWPMLTMAPIGNRYFFFPMLAWLAMLVSLACDRAWLPRLLGSALLLPVLLWAVPHDWAILRFPRTDFLVRARMFEAAPAGTVMRFPLVPPGLPPMVLVKRPG